MCVPRENVPKDVNVKVFNMIRRKNEVKTLVKHILCDCKCKCNSTTCNSDQKWNNDTCHCEKSIVYAKKIIVGILAHVFVRTVSI